MKDFDSDPTAISVRPPAPHFDDEATLVSARPVVPIATGKSSERSRIVRRALPFIIIAGFVGTLIGGGIGYYAKRRISTNVVNESSTAPESKRNETASEQQRMAPRAQSQQIETESNVSVSSSENKSSTSETDSVAIPTANETSHLKRARRPLIHTVATASSNRPRASTRRGAARIQEIFAGANPQ